jgi:hypothetical protein
MRIILALILMGFWASNALAQNIEYDKKTGLVLVDGKEAFYFTQVGRGLIPDFKLENLEHKELAFYKNFKTGEEYNSSFGKMVNVYVFRVTFSNSLNTCDVATAPLKFVLKDIVNYGLIKNGAIDPLAEERYVLGNGGQLQRNNEPSKVIVNVASPENAAPGNTPKPSPSITFEDIRIENDQIYNQDNWLGSYKISSSNGVSTVVVYDATDNKVAIATHEDNSEDDWSVIIMENSQKVEIRHYTQAALNRLFFSLVQRNVLK